MDQTVCQIQELIEKSGFSHKKILRKLEKHYETLDNKKKHTKKRKIKVCRPPLYISDSSTDNENL